MWAAHEADAGGLMGWEERGPDWRGFSGGGTKALFRFGDRAGTLYVSTGGGWSPATAAALRALAGHHGTVLVAATDADAAGETFAVRLSELAEAAGCGFTRLPPQDGPDWNVVLQRAAGLAPL